MMRPFNFWIAAALVVGSLCLHPLGVRAVGGEDEQRVFESLFGAKIRQTQQASPREKVALAEEMLAAARTSTQHRGLVALLCQHAYELTANFPEGHGTAIEAMKLMATEVPDQRLQAHKQLSEVYQVQFRRSRGDQRNEVGEAWIESLLIVGKANIAEGRYVPALGQFRQARATATAIRSPRDGEIRTLGEWAAHRQRIASQLADLEAQLERQPDRKDLAERLVRGYLLELDEPAGAGRHVAAVSDESLKAAALLAARDLPNLEAEEVLRLADWYHDQSKGLSGVGRLPILYRAQRLYERFLELHAPADLLRKKAELALKQIRPQAEGGSALALHGSGGPEKQIAVSLKVDCPEAPRIIAEVAQQFPDVVEGVERAELLRFHNATDLRVLRGGSPERVPGAYAGVAVVGAINGIMIGGPPEVLERGQYLVVYRMQYAGVVEGEELSFLDVASEGITVNGFRPKTADIQQGQWNALPVRVTLHGPKNVDYRLWPLGRRIALDRVYIFKIN